MQVVWIVWNDVLWQIPFCHVLLEGVPAQGLAGTQETVQPLKAGPRSPFAVVLSCLMRMYVVAG